MLEFGDANAHGSLHSSHRGCRSALLYGISPTFCFSTPDKPFIIRRRRGASFQTLLRRKRFPFPRLGAVRTPRFTWMFRAACAYLAVRLCALSGLCI